MSDAESEWMRIKGEWDIAEEERIRLEEQDLLDW